MSGIIEGNKFPAALWEGLNSWYLPSHPPFVGPPLPPYRRATSLFGIFRIRS
jgi:hypothetical protein